MFFFFNRVTDTLTYSGLTLTATSLAGNRFLNFFFSTLVEYISFTVECIMLRSIIRIFTKIKKATYTCTVKCKKTHKMNVGFKRISKKRYIATEKKVYQMSTTMASSLANGQ